MSDEVQVVDVQPEANCRHNLVPDACKKCQGAAKKRESRERIKQKAAKLASEKKMHEAKGWIPFWEQKRATLPEATRLEYESREEDVVLLEELMEARVSGVYNSDTADDLSLDEFAAIVSADVKEHGTVAIEVLLIPNLWQEGERRTWQMIEKMFGADSPTLVAMKYGYRTTVSSKRFHEWQQFSTKVNPTQKFDTGTMISCSYATCTSLPEWVSSSVAETYVRLGKPYKCARCREAEKKFHTPIAPVTSAEIRDPAAASQIFDAWGRIRTDNQ